MAPRTHYAKSQEVVYKRLGTSARPKYKALYAKLPVHQKSENISNSQCEPSGPSGVDPPHGEDDPSLLAPDEGSSSFHYEMPQRTKKV